MDGTPRPFRKSNNRVIAGVCAGVSEWLGWSPLAGRCFFLLICWMSVIVPGILVYIVLTIMMPKAEPPATLPDPNAR